MSSGTLKRGKFGTVWPLNGSNSISQTRHVSNSKTNSLSECLLLFIDCKVHNHAGTAKCHPSPHSLPARTRTLVRSCMKFNMFRFPAQPTSGGAAAAEPAQVALLLLLLRDCRHCPRVGSVTRVIRSVRKEKERAAAAAMMTTATTTIPHA